MEKQNRSPVRLIFTIIVDLLIAVLVLALGVVLFCTVTEYRPADVEDAEMRSVSGPLYDGESLTVVTWNIGYGALGDNADFFMDGGSSVYTADLDRVLSNMDGIMNELNELSPDVMFLQETDRNSSRSHGINEADMITGMFSDYSYAFANNFKVAYIPYPIPPIGKVDSGLLTLSRYGITDSPQRIQLPVPFKWPIRTANLKRCLLVTRTRLEDSDRELVLINLHLEAYDSGEGKIAQTNMLREYMNAELEKGNYVIVGGDFNQTFSNIDTSAYPVTGEWSPGSIDAADFEGWQLLADSSSPTCRTLSRVYTGADKSTFQFYVIDGFMVSSNVTVESCETVDLDFKCSDHNPVVLKVTLSGN